MKFKYALPLLIVLFIWAGCAGPIHSVGKEKKATGKKPIHPKAYNHYLEGALYDFQDQYVQALIEYYQALLYDSTSAQIYKAIARDMMRLQNYESAIEYLKKAYKLDPRDPEILNYLGESYYNLKKFRQAISYYEKLFEKMPTNETVRNNLIFLYNSLKMYPQLAELYHKLQEIYPENDEYVMQYALTLIKAGDLDRAERALQEVIRRDSTQVAAYFLLGSIYEKRQQDDRAIEIYKRILKFAPDSHEAINNLYTFLRKREDWQSIEKIFGGLLQQDSTNIQVRLILAETYFFRKEFDKARSLLEPVLEDERFRPTALEMLGRIAFQEQKFDEAENYFSLLTKEQPENRFGWIFLAILYNRQHNYGESIRVLRQALGVLPDNTDILSLYGNTLMQAGQDSAALEPLEKANRLAPEDIDIIAALANVYDRLKMWDKCDSLYEAALLKYPDNALLLNNYSYSLSERGEKLDRALQMAQRALEQEPDNGAYLDTMGWIYFKLGDYQKALEYIQEAVKVREESAEVLEHLGDVYQKLNQPEKAREYWQKALEKDPENEELKQKLQEL